MNDFVGIIIQARMGSTRLPGKVLLSLGKSTLLGELINRLNYIKNKVNIVVATTKNCEDNVIVDYCEKLGVKCYRGSELDVLDRYYRCAKFYGFSRIVRVTADNPLTCISETERLIDFHIKGGFDVSSNRGLPIGTGVGIVNLDALEAAHRFGIKPYHREHVTLYFYDKENIKDFNIGYLNAKGDLFRPDLRLTVDTKEDYELMRIIYNRCLSDDYIRLDSVIDFLDKNPELLNINKNIKQRDPWNE